MKIVVLTLLTFVYAQYECRNQDIPDAHSARLSFRKGLRRRDLRVRKRSIVKCESDVEELQVPERATAYRNVSLGGVVTIVETSVPLTDGVEIEREALPVCSGVFVDEHTILSSAHCVYHQRRYKGDAKFWMYGEERTFLYAIGGKVSEHDTKFDVYSLNKACIPQSYINARDEDSTSVMSNDLVLFSTSRQYTGEVLGIGEEMATGMREYLLMQYPADVGGGERLVIDWNVAEIRGTHWGGGVFWSIDLASWAGSSGGPIVDVEKKVIVGVLMSSGWQVCDSGFVPVVGDVLQGVWQALKEDVEESPTPTEEEEMADSKDSLIQGLQTLETQGAQASAGGVAVGLAG